MAGSWSAHSLAPPPVVLRQYCIYPPVPPLFPLSTTKAYFILDELLLAGELQEPSKRVVLQKVEAQDQLVEQVKSGLSDEKIVITGPRG